MIDSNCYMLELLDGLKINSSIWGQMMMEIQQLITLVKYVTLSHELQCYICLDEDGGCRCNTDDSAKIRIHTFPILSIRLSPTFINQEIITKSIYQISPISYLQSRVNRIIRMVPSTTGGRGCGWGRNGYIPWQSALERRWDRGNVVGSGTGLGLRRYCIEVDRCFLALVWSVRLQYMVILYIYKGSQSSNRV